LPRIARLAPDLDIEAVARSRFVPGGARRFGDVCVYPMYAPRTQGGEALVSTFLGILRARKRGASLVHIHGIGPGLLAPLARLLGMRVVLTHHSLNYEHSKWSAVGRTILRAGERMGIASADAVIAVAPWLGRRLRTNFPDHAAKVQVIPNGAATFPKNQSANAAILDELGLVSGGYILAVGRLVPEKNFGLLLDAAKTAVVERPVVIVGGTDHDSDYGRALLRRAGPKVIFAGKRDRGQLAVLYANAGLFVLPSTHEGMPLVAIEAARFAAPLLLSDIEANRDLGLPDRHYFRSGDVDDLARALTQPASDFALQSSIHDQFDWNKIAAETLSIYRAVLRPVGHRQNPAKQ
jgi:glycosyltransferase involved in cell wall biosynthesis